MAEVDDNDVEDIEEVDEDDEDEVESPALRAERISKEMSNQVSTTGPENPPISQGGDQPDEVPDYRSP